MAGSFSLLLVETIPVHAHCLRPSQANRRGCFVARGLASRNDGGGVGHMDKPLRASNITNSSTPL